MLNLNRATLLGQAGRNPELIALKNNARAAVFSLATTERWRDREADASQPGPLRERTEWHRIVVYGPTVDIVEQRVRKGSTVLVEGKLSIREYTDGNDNVRNVTEIIVAGPKAMVNVLDSGGTKDQNGAARS